MSELFDEEEDKSLVADEEVVDGDGGIITDTREQPNSDARRRLEDLLEEKRSKKELEDVFDDFE